MSSITSLVIRMGSAIDALDKILKSPVENNHIKIFISITLIKDLQDEKMLKLLPDLQVNQQNTDETLLIMFSFISKWNKEINESMSICNINTESYMSFWQNLSQEYYNKQINGTSLMLYNYLNYKIITFTQWAIQKKYVNLGFKFNVDTNETLIPHKLESSETEHFYEDTVIVSTQILNDENIEEKSNCEDSRNNHESQNKSSLLIDIPKQLRTFNRYL
ncbi:uncharacterized protein LOC126902744 [Daktulosphaira vitifoliae]|uniref:uncharacterized protein LOC126902744 n=1 Tax=Daktulosphaira vitifoliae TaxID=58002 RepID=UPI0021A9C20F|nr:uncharacterized protein LOC126902744 [Daktulosphaira vitifoliae]